MHFFSRGAHERQFVAVVPDGVRNSCVISVGRLLELRVRAGFRTSAEVNQFFDGVRLELTRLTRPQHRAVVVADWRLCPPLSDEISRLLLERTAVTNPSIQAVGIVASRESPGDVVQVLRGMCGAKYPGRRLFFEHAELISWAHPFLTGAEFRRLRAFIDESESSDMPVSAAGRVLPKCCG